MDGMWCGSGFEKQRPGRRYAEILAEKWRKIHTRQLAINLLETNFYSWWQIFFDRLCERRATWMGCSKCVWKNSVPDRWLCSIPAYDQSKIIWYGKGWLSCNSDSIEITSICPATLIPSSLWHRAGQWATFGKIGQPILVRNLVVCRQERGGWVCFCKSQCLFCKKNNSL